MYYPKKLLCRGGGSAAALTAASGVALLSMVAHYSLGKSGLKRIDNRLQKIIEQTKDIKDRLVQLVDLDAQAYLQVTKTKKAPAKEKNKALREARKIPIEIGKLCYKAVQMAPFLVEKGNKYLISDVVVGVEMLQAAFNGAQVLIES